MLNTIQQIDENILLYLLNHFHTPILDKIMIFITSMGNSGLIWIALTFILLLNKKTRPCGILLTCALSIEFLVGDHILKPLIQRERPFVHFPEVEMLIKRPGSYSFPSGHTMSSFTAATVIFFSNKRAGIAAFILAGLIGFSRLYLFCHYPSDVLGGAVFGTLVSLTVITFANYIRVKASVTQK